MDRDALRQLCGRSQELAGAQVLLLNGEPALYVIEQGSVAVFGTRIVEGRPEGARRPLFRLGEGQAVAAVPQSGSAPFALMLAPVDETLLRRVDLTTCRPGGVGNGNLPMQLVEDWINRLAEVFASLPSPSMPTRADNGSTVTLDGGAALRTRGDTVSWIDLHGSSACLMGADYLDVGNGRGPLPMGQGMWLEAREQSRALAASTESLSGSDALIAGLIRLHGLALAQLEHVVAEDDARESARLRSRTIRQQSSTGDALYQLASVMDPREAPPALDTPLLTAVAAACQRLGVAIQPPAGSALEDAGDLPVEAIARANRIRTRRVILSGSWWQRDAGPLLAFSADDQHRPLALLQTRSLRYVIFDPVTRARTPVDKRSARGLHAEATMFYRPLPARALGLMDLFRFSIRGRGRDIIIILLTGLVGTLLGMITPQATAVLMDHVIPDADHDLLVQMGLALLAAAFGRSVFMLSEGLVSTRLGIGAECTTQAAMWDRVLSLRPSFFRDYSSGELQSRVLAVNAVGRELNGATLRSILSSFMALLNLGLLIYYSASLALIAVVVVAIGLVFTAVCGTRIRRLIRPLQEVSGKLHGLVIQLVGGVTKLRVAGAEERAYIHWVRRYTRELKLMLASQRIQDVVTVFNLVLPTLALIALYWLGIGRLLEPGSGTSPLSIGVFLAFYTAFGTFLSGATQLSSTLIGILDTITMGQYVKPLLEASPEVDVAKTDPGRLQGRVALDRVVFRYREGGPKILDETSLATEPGEFVALVGPSGSGKSTLFRLLLGFETPEAGGVLYDGHDLSGLDVAAVRRQLGVVLQSGRLSVGSIFENIASGRVITLEQAWEAARDAGLAEDVEALPMGMHTIITEGGGNLSGGQRQRLLIARALVMKPRILLFDEATSALDNRTQDIVSSSLQRRNVTRIVIAHRLSTIRDADRIHYIDRGRIIEEGRFEDLVDAGGPFSRMMERQRV